jgi:hypothetical protein
MTAYHRPRTWYTTGVGLPLPATRRLDVLGHGSAGNSPESNEGSKSLLVRRWTTNNNNGDVFYPQVHSFVNKRAAVCSVAPVPRR